MKGKYSPDDKAAYRQMCRRYNTFALFLAADGPVDYQQEFIEAALALHQQAALVPDSWRRIAFIEAQGRDETLEAELRRDVWELPDTEE